LIFNFGLIILRFALLGSIWEGRDWRTTPSSIGTRSEQPWLGIACPYGPWSLIQCKRTLHNLPILHPAPMRTPLFNSAHVPHPTTYLQHACSFFPGERQTLMLTLESSKMNRIFAGIHIHIFHVHIHMFLFLQGHEVLRFHPEPQHWGGAGRALLRHSLPLPHGAQGEDLQDYHFQCIPHNWPGREVRRGPKLPLT